MRTLRKIALILVILGLILCAVAAIGSGFDLNLLINDARTLCTRDYEAADVQNVSLTLDVDSIVVKPSEDGSVHLSWYSRDPQKDTLNLSGGVLSLKTARPPLFSLNLRNYDAVLALPADYRGEMRLTTSTGSISVSDLNPTLLAMEATTGSIHLTNVNVAGRIDAETSTGSVSMTNVTANEISSKSTTGSAKLSSVCASTLSAKATTGSITLGAVDAQSLTLRTTTGSIKGTLAGSLVDYTIRSSVSTGSNSLPEELDGGARTLNANATTGSIRITFSDAK